jgi:hypothetical protein
MIGLRIKIVFDQSQIADSVDLGPVVVAWFLTEKIREVFLFQSSLMVADD